MILRNLLMVIRQNAELLKVSISTQANSDELMQVLKATEQSEELYPPAHCFFR